MKLFIVIGLIVFVLIVLTRQDSDKIPYALRGMDVYLYNDKTSEEFLVKRVDGSYLSKDKVLRDCQDEAYLAARSRKIQYWSYSCCTVTHSSDCATRIK